MGIKIKSFKLVACFQLGPSAWIQKMTATTKEANAICRQIQPFGLPPAP
jgi:hypothetical protein